MMKRGQVFVRAQDETGKWGSADVLDLDDDSFRVFIVGTLMRKGFLASLEPDDIQEDFLTLRTRPGVHFERATP